VSNHIRYYPNNASKAGLLDMQMGYIPKWEIGGL